MSFDFSGIIARIAQRATVQQGDYYNGDLLYCGKCKTPKEMHIELCGKDMIVRKACDCVAEAERLVEEQEKIQRRRNQIEESLQGLRELGCARMPQYNFSMCDDRNPELKKRMMKYAQKFDEIADKNIGLLLYGDTGTGKTFFGECIASEVLKQGRFAWLTSVTDIVNAVSGTHGNQMSYVLNYVKNVDLLILEDLGTERDTSFMWENLYNIIDTRYMAKRPLVVTTNIDPKGMMANMNINIKRIGERLAESCVPIEVKGTSRRVEKAQEKLSQLKKFFDE